MNPDRNDERKTEMLSQIAKFVSRSPGLEAGTGVARAHADLLVRQSVDGKELLIAAPALEDVLLRVDADGRDFIQVNFTSGGKILLTGALIGFKPARLSGLASARLPKVVTTPDIVSVFEAIQDSLHLAEAGLAADDLPLLRHVFEAVLSGGEEAGFDLRQERQWLSRIPSRFARATA